MKTFPNNPFALAWALFPLLLTFVSWPLNAETPQSIKLAAIPQMTMVEVRYRGDKVSDEQPPDLSTPNAMIAKGRQSQIKSQSWPDNKTTCDVRINGWRFFTDPAARNQYRDYVQVMAVTQDDEGQADFPELNFVNSQARVSEDKFRGKAAWLVTSAPKKPDYSEQAIASILQRIGNGPDHNEIESRLREAQRLEAKRATEPPNCAWIDPATSLPLAARIDGVMVSYSYKTIEQMPSLPTNIQAAIREKFGKLPEF